MTCEETTLALGAYVLGALEPDERRQVRDHLSQCRRCAEEYAEFEGLPALLDRVRLEDLQNAPVTPSPDLFDRVAAAAAAENRRVRRRWLLVAAAVVALFAGGIGAVVWTSVGGQEQTQSVVAGSVHVTVQAAGDENGTTLDVTARGLPPRTDCQLVVVDRAGHRHGAGWWKATYEGEASFKGWSEVPRSDVADLLLLDKAGQQLIRVPL
jgi:hypothetical protein